MMHPPTICVQNWRIVWFEFLPYLGILNWLLHIEFLNSFHSVNQNILKLKLCMLSAQFRFQGTKTRTKRAEWHKTATIPWNNRVICESPFILCSMQVWVANPTVKYFDCHIFTARFSVQNIKVSQIKQYDKNWMTIK